MSIKLQEARITDVFFLYKWRNLQENVDLSASRRKVGFFEHIKWYMKHQWNKDQISLFILNDNKRCGYIRLEKSNECLEVSIYILSDMQNQGLASAAMREVLAQKNAKNSVMVAKIRSDNANSIKFFEKIGFYLKSDEGQMLVYELDQKDE